MLRRRRFADDWLLMDHYCVRYSYDVCRCWRRWRCIAVIVDGFRFMRRNHPRFGAQISRRRYDRNAAGIVMAAVAAAAWPAVAAVVGRLLLLLCLARMSHVFGRNSTTDTAVVDVVGLPVAATMLLLLLLLVQWHHVRQRGLLLLMVMVVSVVGVDPRSLGRHIRRGHARQVGQMGRWWRGMGHVLGRGWMSVHHRCWIFCCSLSLTRENYFFGTAPLLLTQFAIVEVVVRRQFIKSTLSTLLVPSGGDLTSRDCQENTNHSRCPLWPLSPRRK